MVITMTTMIEVIRGGDVVVVVMKTMMGILRNTVGGRVYIPPYKLIALMMKDEKAKKTELALKLLTF